MLTESPRDHNVTGQEVPTACSPRKVAKISWAQRVSSLTLPLRFENPSATRVNNCSKHTTSSHQVSVYDAEYTQNVLYWCQCMFTGTSIWSLTLHVAVACIKSHQKANTIGLVEWGLASHSNTFQWYDAKSGRPNVWAVQMTVFCIMCYTILLLESSSSNTSQTLTCNLIKNHLCDCTMAQYQRCSIMSAWENVMNEDWQMSRSFHQFIHTPKHSAVHRLCALSLTHINTVLPHLGSLICNNRLH